MLHYPIQSASKEVIMLKATNGNIETPPADSAQSAEVNKELENSITSIL